jgi:aspartate/methionine/tyrosine aminotransferase
MHLATLLVNAGETRRAEKYYKHALKIDPENIDAHYSLGKLIGLPGLRLGVLACANPSLKQRFTTIKRQFALHSCPLSEKAFCQISDAVQLSGLHAQWRSRLAARTRQLAEALSDERYKTVVGPFTIVPSELCQITNALGVPGEAFGLCSSNTRICLASSNTEWNAFMDGLRSWRAK